MSKSKVTGANRDDAPEDAGSVTPELCDILLAGLRALADDGDADLACRLAGRACAVLRRSDGVQWHRFNVLLHRLIPKTGPVGTGSVGTGGWQRRVEAVRAAE